MELIKLLRDYFPTAVFTGKSLVFVSEDWRVELTEHKDSDFSKNSKEPAFTYFVEVIELDPAQVGDEDFKIPSNYKKKD